MISIVPWFFGDIVYNLRLVPNHSRTGKHQHINRIRCHYFVRHLLASVDVCRYEVVVGLVVVVVVVVVPFLGSILGSSISAIAEVRFGSPERWNVNMIIHQVADLVHEVCLVLGGDSRRAAIYRYEHVSDIFMRDHVRHDQRFTPMLSLSRL